MSPRSLMIEVHVFPAETRENLEAIGPDPVLSKTEAVLKNVGVAEGVLGASQKRHVVLERLFLVGGPVIGDPDGGHRDEFRIVGVTAERPVFMVKGTGGIAGSAVGNGDGVQRADFRPGYKSVRNTCMSNGGKALAYARVG